MVAIHMAALFLALRNRSCVEDRETRFDKLRLSLLSRTRQIEEMQQQQFESPLSTATAPLAHDAYSSKSG